MGYHRRVQAGSSRHALRRGTYMLKVLRIGLAVTLVALLAACGGGDEKKDAGKATAAPQATTAAGAQATAAPQVKGKLTVYSALDQTTIDALTAAFKKKYPD